MVVALGGGAFSQQENFELLEGNGVTIWLDVSRWCDRGWPRMASRTVRWRATPIRWSICSSPAARAYQRADYRIEVTSDDVNDHGEKDPGAADFLVSRERQLRRDALRDFPRCAKAADPREAILAEMRRVWLASDSKTSTWLARARLGAAMAAALERVPGLRDRARSGEREVRPHRAPATRGTVRVRPSSAR